MKHETSIDQKNVNQLLTPEIMGKFKNVPRTGTRRRKFTATGKKPLKEKLPAI